MAVPDLFAGAPDSLRPLLAELHAREPHEHAERINPHEQVRALLEAGVGAVRLPIEAGGAGYTNRQLFEMIIAIAAADGDVAHILRNHFFEVEGLRGGGSALADRLRTAVSGGALIGNATTEPRAGTVDFGRLTTTLLRRGDGYLLNGTKVFTTGTLFSDVVVVAAALEDGSTVQAVVPTHRDGVAHLDDWDGIGQRRTGSGTTTFTDVAVSADEVRGSELIKTEPAETLFPFPQLYLHALIVGALRKASQETIELVAERKRTYTHALGDVPREDPILLGIVGEVVSAEFVISSAVLAAADLLDAVEAASDPKLRAALAAEASAAVSKIKIATDDLALAATSKLFEVGGASAAKRSKGLDRHWRNVRTITLHNPVRYKGYVLGGHVVNDTPFPGNGYF